jgi:hypothetical protein
VTTPFGKNELTRFGRFWPVFLGVLWIACTPPSAATAQQPERGVVHAVAFEPLPEGAPVLVRPLDDTDENLAIKKEFETAMAADGLNVTVDKGRLVLSFEAREEVAAGPAPRPQTTIRFRGQGGRMSTSDERNVPKLIEAPRDGTRIYRPSRYRIDATIDDKVDGTRLWQGWAVAGLDEHTHLFLAKTMVPAIVDSIGQTVREKPFPLQ